MRRSFAWISFTLLPALTVAGCATSPDPGSSTPGEGGTAHTGSGAGSSSSSGGGTSTSSGGGHSGSSSSSSSGGKSGSSGGPADASAGGGYTVRGASVYDSKGNVHMFRGVDRPSLEWSSTGNGNLSETDYQVMQMWHANVVRVSLNQDFWLNDPSNTLYDPTYAATVAQQVQWAEEYGMDVILDLHWSDQGSYSVGAACVSSSNGNCQQDMADAHSVTFWQELAAAYKSDPHVLFELYNEPKIGGYMPSSSDWDTWLNGGTSSGFTVHGMQELYSTVRATGAQNVVIIGGLSWAFDLSGVPTHAVSGTNIMYATHPYQTDASSTWDAKFGSLSATYPIIATEFGDRSGSCSTGYATSFVAYANKKNSGDNPPNEISWTAWAFYYTSTSPCTFPTLLADMNYNPNAAGMVIEQALMAGP